MKPDEAKSRGTENVTYVHLTWPQERNSALYAATELEMAAEAMRAHAFLASEIAPGAEILWREPPNWQHEREYDTQRTRSWLQFRASAISR